MAVVATVSTDNNDNTDNAAITADMHYTAIFMFGECIICILKHIICRLLVPVMEDNNNIDDDDDEEEIEEMKEEL